MKVFIFVLATLADWEVGYILPELNSGRYFSNKDQKVEIVKISTSTNTIKTLGGIDIKPDDTIYNVTFNEGDILILPGANTWLEPENLAVMKTVEELLEKGVTVCAICGATTALAESGILDTRKHTSNDKEYLKMFCESYKGDNNYLNKPVAVDNNLITASGLAPLEFSLEVLKATDMFDTNTLEYWYKLNKTGEAQYFYQLMNTLK